MRGAYSLLNRLEGRAECLLRGAEPAGFLNRCAGAGVPVLSAAEEDVCCLRLTLRARDGKRARRLALKSGCELEMLTVSGGKTLERQLLRRWLPLFCTVLLLTGLAVSKLYIWEMEVTGNRSVSGAKILAALSDCGVSPGSFWPAYTADNLRSELMVRLPELAWVTVNIRGSRAEVIVRERVDKPALKDEKTAVDLVAARSGFVIEVRALRGTALVRRGSAVTAGEVLISAEADSAFSGRRTEHALGTVRAETFAEYSAAVPATRCTACPTGKEFTRWALCIGKNRVNFYGNSSICPADCDKITDMWNLKVSGLFSLPVSLVRERYAPYGTSVCDRDGSALRREVEQLLHERLTASLGEDGSVEQETFSCCPDGETVVVCLRARCSENIAIEQKRIQEDEP